MRFKTALKPPKINATVAPDAVFVVVLKHIFLYIKRGKVSVRPYLRP